MNIILHDVGQQLTFAPLTLTRPVGNLRMGMWTNDQRWKMYCPEATISYYTTAYLSEKFPEVKTEDNIWVNAGVIPNLEFVQKIKALKKEESLYVNGVFAAFRGEKFAPKKVESQPMDCVIVQERWDLYLKNDEVLKTDFQFYTNGKKGQQLSETNLLIGDKSQLFIEKGASVEGAILNVKEGPIYMGKDAEIMEGSVVRGGLAMAPHSVLKMSSKVYGATSLGEYCKVGGEVNNVIFQAYSNKGHDGFIGNALIGEWCNLGADTNCSNLKNNYGKIRSYDYATDEMVETNQQFMGVAMGDYSKTSINTMLNTGTVVGVCANIFTSGFPPKFVHDFSWGGENMNALVDMERAFVAANRMMGRRGKEMTAIEKEILFHLRSEWDKKRRIA